MTAIRRELHGERPATLGAVEECCSQFRVWAEFEELPDCFAVELLLREALTNAVVHGCGNDASKLVSWTLRLHAGRLFVAVRDPGRGFDWRTARELRASIDACSGRGIEIYECFASRMRFNRQGNAIFLIKRLSDQSVLRREESV